MAGLYGTINNAWIRYKIRTLGYLCTCPVLSEDSVDPMCICTPGISQKSIEANLLGIGSVCSHALLLP